MRDRFPIVLIGGLLLVGALGSLLLQGAQRGEFADRLSTYRSGKGGARALYLLLEQSGLKVRRQQKSLELIDPGTQLVLLGPRFSDARMARVTGLFDADDAGVDPDEHDDYLESGVNAFRAPTITKDELDRLLEHARNGATVFVATWQGGGAPLLDALSVTTTRRTELRELRTLVPAQPSAYVAGLERLEAKVQATFDSTSPSFVPLLLDEGLGAPVMAAVSWGQGRVVLLGAPELATNAALRRADNARFWVNVGQALGRGGAVTFDEYHHGFAGDRSMGDFAARYGLSFAVGQLVLGLAVWALSLRRFGRPLPLVESARLSATDALSATSRLYREGGHHGHAAQAILKALASELSFRAGLSSRSAAGDVSASLAARGETALAERLLAVTRAAALAHTEAGVLHVAQLAAAVRASLKRSRRKEAT